jgi:hypothetical protein
LESLPFRQIDSSAAADKAWQDPMVTKVETMLEAKMQLVKAHTDKGNTYQGPAEDHGREPVGESAPLAGV